MEKNHKKLEIKVKREPSPTDVRRAPVKAVHSHPPQPTHTLMRRVVHKPGGTFKQHLKAVGAADRHLAETAVPLAVKHSAQRLDRERLKHAGQVKKSALISRFGQLDPVHPTPATLPAPATKSRQSAPTALRPAKHPQTTAELLQHALELASSHEQPPLKPQSRNLAHRVASRRITGVSALVVASCLLFGIVLYSDSTAIRLHVASSKAGFAASLPGYQPSGYRLNHLSYSSGTVAFEFQSNSDNRTYAITEQASEWDSQALRDNLLSRLGQDYQTVEAAGRTLYVYGQNNATWVSSGVWYQIKTDGALSAHQLVELATSM